jgi:hypothetical protein
MLNLSILVKFLKRVQIYLISTKSTLKILKKNNLYQIKITNIRFLCLKSVITILFEMFHLKIP